MAKKLNKSGKNYSIKVTLGHAHVSRLVWAYTREVEESLGYVKQIKNLDEILEKSPVLTRRVLSPLYENLSVLEPLMECYLAGRDGKTFETGFNNGDGQLYDLLEKIRRLIKEFPSKLEDFYQNYSINRKQLLAKSPVCEICKERGANHYFSNVKVHNQCLGRVNSKYCEYCGNLYLNNEQKCNNKSECSSYELKKAEATKGPYGSISMQIPKEVVDKAKETVKEKGSNYKERGGN